MLILVISFKLITIRKNVKLFLKAQNRRLPYAVHLER